MPVGAPWGSERPALEVLNHLGDGLGVTVGSGGCVSYDISQKSVILLFRCLSQQKGTYAGPGVQVGATWAQKSRRQCSDLERKAQSNQRYSQAVISNAQSNRRHSRAGSYRHSELWVSGFGSPAWSHAENLISNMYINLDAYMGVSILYLLSHLITRHAPG